ncbi:MAG TPA: hypothetical protein VK968_04495 [Roseimicrobium sp.]|nr:hypothetical protein [Roseimicrobium sp.]
MKLVANIFAVVVILGLLTAIIIPTGGCGRSKESSITLVEMGQAGAALQLYNQEYGQLPVKTDNAMLVQILEGDNPRKLKFYILDRERSKTGQFLDGWGKPLLFRPNSTGLLIRSAGKDGIYYTQDDITQEAQVRAPATPSVQ